MERGLFGVYSGYQVHPLSAEDCPPGYRLFKQVACHTYPLEMPFHCINKGQQRKASVQHLQITGLVVKGGTLYRKTVVL